MRYAFHQNAHQSRYLGDALLETLPFVACCAYIDTPPRLVLPLV
jgi:hypothetical protein